jgi:mono/diheme cytochrome c family protein
VSGLRLDARHLPPSPAATARIVGVVTLAALFAVPLRPGLAEPAATAESAWAALPAAAGASSGNSLERRGLEVFDRRCAACHGPIPAEIYGPTFLPPMPGTQALAARYRGELPAELAQRTDLAAVYIRTVVRNGYVSMPFFRPTELSDEDLDALVAYLTRERR